MHSMRFSMLAAATASVAMCSAPCGEDDGDCAAAVPHELLDDDMADPLLEGQTSLLQVGLHMGNAHEAAVLKHEVAASKYRFSGNIQSLIVRQDLVPKEKAVSCPHTLSAYGQKVSDDCCNPGWWGELAIQEPPKDQAKDGKHFDCFVEEDPASHLRYRAYAGCIGPDEADVRFGNLCTPEGTSVGKGFPMNRTDTDAFWQDGTWESCRCGDAGRLQPGAVEGIGCFSVTSPISDSVTIAIFANIQGKCEATSEVQATKAVEAAGLAEEQVVRKRLEAQAAKAAEAAQLAEEEAAKRTEEALLARDEAVRQRLALLAAEEAAASKYKFSGSIQSLIVRQDLVPKEKAASCPHTLSSYGQKVSDDCCNPGWWGELAIQEPPKEQAKDGEHFDCFVEEDPSTHLRYRAYAGCIGPGEADVRFGNLCTPEGTSVGKGFPMNRTDTDAFWQHGTWESCRCGDAGRLQPGPVEGIGCFSVTSPISDSVTIAVFANIQGTCEAK